MTKPACQPLLSSVKVLILAALATTSVAQTNLENPPVTTEAAKTAALPNNVEDNAGSSTSVNPPDATENLRNIPRDAYATDPALGIKQRSLFRYSGSPTYANLRAGEPSPRLQTSSITERISLDLPTLSGRFPLLDQGFAPTDADLKVGPLYFNVRALSVGVLWSDNVNLSKTNREEDTIAIARLTMSAMAQLTESLQLAVSGNLIWLPLQGTFGVTGQGIQLPYDLGLDGTPALESQFSWLINLFGWPVLIADDLRLSSGRFNLGTESEYELFEGVDFDEEDRAGRYVFRAPRTRRSDGERRDFEETETNLLYTSNTISASTHKDLPGKMVLGLRGYHENLWYNQDGRGQPIIRDGVNARLSLERENMRFKPYLSYSATRTDRVDWQHSFLLGTTGPLGDYATLYGAVGLFIRSNSSKTWIGNAGISHEINSLTKHRLGFTRQYSELSESLNTRVSYNISRVLGPKLIADAYASYGTFEDDQGGAYDRSLFRTGLRISAFLGPKTTARVSGSYSKADFSNTGEDETGAGFRDYESWTGRFELSYRFTDTLTTRLLYQYRQRTTEAENSKYYENYVFWTITKYFD